MELNDLIKIINEDRVKTKIIIINAIQDTVKTTRYKKRDIAIAKLNMQCILGNFIDNLPILLMLKIQKKYPFKKRIF